LSPARQARRTLRFPLQTTVTFRWTNGNGDEHQGEGRSRDVSEHGAFVLAPDCPPVGTNVVLKIALEGIANGMSALPMELKGEVLRVEQPPAQAGNGGFAVGY
jgi:hypothetical protein